MMGSIIRKLAIKLAEKAKQVDATDIFTQMGVDDVIQIIKGLL